MTKTKAAGILGALILTAFTLFPSPPASGESPTVIVSMVTGLRRYCQRGELYAACRYLGNLIQPFAPLAEDFNNLDDPAKVKAFIQVAVDRMPPALGRFTKAERSCDGCIQKVSDLENLLAQNGTARDIVDMMDDACPRKFRSPELAAQCADEVRHFVPLMIDTILANAPPITACELGKRRPMNYCE